MEIQEAIKWQNAFRKNYDGITLQGKIACDMAVSVLEKQIPKKPITYRETNRADCPICGATVRGIDKPFGKFCVKCGQKLDWSE